MTGFARGEHVSTEILLCAVMNDALAEQRRQHAIPLSLKNDAWSSIAGEPVFPWLVAGIAAIDQRSLQIVIVGWGGQVSVIDGDTCHREGIQRKDSKDVSIVRSVATIDNVVYEAGMRGHVTRAPPRACATNGAKDPEQ